MKGHGICKTWTVDWTMDSNLDRFWRHKSSVSSSAFNFML